MLFRILKLRIITQSKKRVISLSLIRLIIFLMWIIVCSVLRNDYITLHF